MTRPGVAAAILFSTFIGGAQAQKTGCAVSDIVVKSSKARFENVAGQNYMRGVAVLTNRCTEAVGVQLQMTALDAKGNPVATRELWPASIRNIPPGDFTFSLDHWLPYDRAMKSFTLSPVEVKRWNP